MVKIAKNEKSDIKSAISTGTTKEIEEMFSAGVHFGYSRSSRHPKMKQYIFGLNNNVEIFDLEKTYSCFEKAKKFLESLAKENKKILIVATKPGVRQLIKKIAKENGLAYVSERWLGGILTNFKIIKERIDYFINLRHKKESGELSKYTKREISQFNKEIIRLERFLNGLEPLTGLPSALIIVDPKKEKTALKESLQMKIPVVAILNSDSNPIKISYPIPANDASIKSVKYLLEKLIKSYKEEIPR